MTDEERIVLKIGTVISALYDIKKEFKEKVRLYDKVSQKKIEKQIGNLLNGIIKMYELLNDEIDWDKW